ncbi:MAG: hypothetical protein NTY12_04445 [Candidatus Falkowbacteria bacterium]|nr:hypothetical protein [Candidatus Falkowbacteria bacterium]
MTWLLYILVVIFTVSIIFLAVQFFNILFRGQAPFISTKKRILLQISKGIKIKPNEVFYELGAGRACLLGLMSKEQPQAQFVALEYAILPYLLACLRYAFSKSDIRIKRQNMFLANLNNANYIYCYLNREMMIKLEKKFTNECKPDTVIISYQFVMPHFRPYKIITASKSEKIYFYRLER